MCAATLRVYVPANKPRHPFRHRNSGKRGRGREEKGKERFPLFSRISSSSSSYYYYREYNRGRSRREEGIVSTGFELAPFRPDTSLVAVFVRSCLSGNFAEPRLTRNFENYSEAWRYFCRNVDSRQNPRAKFLLHRSFFLQSLRIIRAKSDLILLRVLIFLNLFYRNFNNTRVINKESLTSEKEKEEEG